MPSKPITFKSEIDVELIHHMGDEHSIVSAARVSTQGQMSKHKPRGTYRRKFTPEELKEHQEFLKARAEWIKNNPQGEPVELTDEQKQVDATNLINYLMKHRHGTPFEHGAVTFFVNAPIFVWREWHRHRIGFCLAGDTEIWTESIGQNHGRTLRKRRLKDLYDVWNNGVHDSMGRVRFLPSVRNQKLRVLNEDTGFFELGGIKDIIQSGVKDCLLVETEHKKGWSLRCSSDHAILTSEGWVKAGDLTGSELIAVSGKKSAYATRQIPPSLRSGIGVWTSMQRTTLINDGGADCHICEKSFHRENLVLDHVIPVTENLKMSLDPDNLKPACISCHREKTNKEQILANRCNVAAARFVRLRRKPYKVSQEMTYDISMNPPHHNFVANGIVVHNSYNEESGRYKQLDPVFYLPPADRPMFCVEGWKPGRPKFLTIEQEWNRQMQDPAETKMVQGPRERYERLKTNLMRDYRQSYADYEENLAMGFDPGLARDGLNVGIFSSCWVTCNPRSIMAFLSLRTHEPEAKFVSYPLYEMEQAARKVEAIFANLWPITYKAFVDNGRVGP